MNSLQEFGENFQERVELAIKNLKAGKGILLVDDESRENEGDLIFAAQQMTEQNMALMIRECSGIVCLCLTAQKIKALGLPPMVSKNTSPYQTAFTISIEAREGVTTGVSAHDRLKTIQAAIAPDARPENLVHPGHVFPLKAMGNGVIERRGHTEGSVDLIKLAGLGQEAVLCELTNVDGTMTRLPGTVQFAHLHKTSVVSIDDICQYRQLTEKAKAGNQPPLRESHPGN